MSRLPHRISTQSVSVLIKGRYRTVNSNSMNFSRLVEALKKPTHDIDEIAQLVDVVTFIALETHGRVAISGDEVRFNGITVYHKVLVDRILEHMRQKIDVAPLANFLDRLMENPSEEVREDLFAWLESGDTPITEDGKIIAFKKVQDDYYSYRSGKGGKVLHALGTIVEIDRQEVDPNRYNECSYGLHFCSYGYLAHYHGNRGRVLIVEIDPADVVAIPTDYNRQKGRTCRMHVVGEVPEDEAEQLFRGRLVGYEDKNAPEFDEDTTTLEEADELASREQDEELPDPYDEYDPYEDEYYEDSDDAEGYWADPEGERDSAENIDELVQHEQDVNDGVTVDLTFERNGVTYTGQRIIDILAENSQRAASAILDVPRATLFDWKKKAEAAGIKPSNE